MSIIPFFFDIDRPFHSISRDFFRPSYDVVPRQFFNHPFERPFGDMLQEWENIMRPMEQLSEAINRLALNEVDAKISSDDEKFQVNVDVQHFSPDEINVKVVNGNVIVEGKHEEKQDQHGYVSRQFVRRYALPKGCLPDTVQSSLSSDGVLTVTAPKVLALPSIGERIVPITPTGPIKKQLGSQEMKSINSEESKECSN
ncbi:PREDICTED: protein lethal(2)essential for life-like [Papilio xuthus]|uniref:Protein lethal(2)essential for life-like n=1 Tax=Papilio xuthus TaxID=66420 RepID=A0AAJ6ZMW8_PAPXU|nr:PREDICTED: protein lethal(2)essential for life-like [Papilio xuthus]